MIIACHRGVNTVNYVVSCQLLYILSPQLLKNQIIASVGRYSLQYLPRGNALIVSSQPADTT